MGVLIVVEHCQSTTFVLKLAKSACYFLKFHIRIRSNFCYYIRLERLKMNLRTSNFFGSRGGATEIVKMISVQTCQISPISED